MIRQLIPILLILTACTNPNPQNLVGQIFEISEDQEECTIIANAVAAIQNYSLFLIRYSAWLTIVLTKTKTCTDHIKSILIH